MVVREKRFWSWQVPLRNFGCVRQLTAIFMQVLSVDAAEDHHEDHNYEGRMHLALLCCRCFETGRMTGRTGRYQPTVCICFGQGTASCHACWPRALCWLPRELRSSVVRTIGYSSYGQKMKMLPRRSEFSHRRIAHLQPSSSTNADESKR